MLVAACNAVIVVEPGPVSVTRPVVVLTVATDSILLEYVMAPSLLEVGAVNVNVGSPEFFVMADIALSVGVAFATVNVAVVVRAVYGVAAAWLAVMVLEPAPTIVTAPVEELIVATPEFELLKVNAPLLVDEGADIVNDASPKVLAGATNEPKVGVAASTTNVVLMVDAV